MLIVKFLNLSAMSFQYIGLLLTLLCVWQYAITDKPENIIPIMFWIFVIFSKQIIYVSLNEITIVNRFTGNVQMSLYARYRNIQKNIKHRRAEYFTNRFVDGFLNIPDKAKKDIILMHRKKYWATTHEGIFSLLKNYIPLAEINYKNIGTKIVPSKFLISKISDAFRHRSFSYLTRRVNAYKITVDLETIEKYREIINRKNQSQSSFEVCRKQPTQNNNNLSI